MDDDELKALVDSEQRLAVGYYGGKLAEQRRRAEYYYLALPKGDLTPPEVDGRSSVISPDVRNTIEAMLPQLMVKFTGGDTVVEFEPQRPDDEETAKQVTDYLNYLFFKKNNGHNICYTMFKDALLLKRGIVKVWWDDRFEETKEEYRAMSDVEMAQVLEDKEIEPISHNAYPDEDDAKQRQQALEQLGQQLQQAMQAAQMGDPQAAQAVQQMQQQMAQIQAAPPVMLHDLEVKRTKKAGKVTIENVPPEEFLISRIAKSIDTASFVGHRLARTKSELRSMGYPESKIENIGSDEAAGWFNAERIEREAFDNEYAYLNVTQEGSDESQQRIWVVEAYVRADYDGDGISELRKVVIAGNEILDNEVVDVVPFASVCPIPMPHKFFGLSVADLAMDSQLARTGLLRAKFDNTFLEANGRYFAVEGQVNLDDLLTSRPGGVVRMKAPNMAGRLDQGAQNNSADMLLEYMEGYLQESTGWTRQSQGNSAGDLQGTATGMNIVTNKDDMRLDLIARNFAEGFTDIFKLMLKLVCQHQQEAAEIRLNGSWLKIDPREWRNQFDTTINVGLGVGNKDQRIQHLIAMRQQQDLTYPLGVTTAVNVYNANKELAKELGFKNADKFFTDPVKNPPPPHPDPEQMKAQAQLPLIQAKAQADAQLKQIDVQATMTLEREKMQMQAGVDQNRQVQEAAQQAAKMEKEAELAQYTAGLEAQKEAARMMHEAEMADKQRAHEAMLKQMELDAKERAEQLKAQVAVHQAEQSRQTSMETAHLSAQTSKETAAMAKQEKAEPKAHESKEKAEPKDEAIHKLADLHGKTLQAVQKLAERVDGIHAHVTSPAKIIRGPDGKAIGVDRGGSVKPISRGKDGRIEGI